MAQPSQKLPSFQTPPLSDGKMLERRGRASIRIISMPFNSFSFSNGKAVTPIFQFQSFSLSLRVHIYILPKKKKSIVLCERNLSRILLSLEESSPRNLNADVTKKEIDRERERGGRNFNDRLLKVVEEN